MTNNKHFNIATRQEFNMYKNLLGTHAAFVGYFINNFDSNLGYIPFTLTNVANDLNITINKVFRSVHHLSDINLFDYYMIQGNSQLCINNGAIQNYGDHFKFNFYSKSQRGFKFYKENFCFTMGIMSYLCGVMDKKAKTTDIKQVELSNDLDINISQTSKAINKLKILQFIYYDDNNTIHIDDEFQKTKNLFFNNM